MIFSEVKSLSRVQLFAIPWTVVYQVSLSMGFSRQEYWSGLPFPSPGDLPDPGIEPKSPALAGGFFTIEPPGKLVKIIISKMGFLISSQKTSFPRSGRSPGEGNGNPL